MVLKCLRNIQTASEVYENIPYAPRHRVQGSMIMYHRMPMVSILADISELPHRGTISRKLAPWLVMNIDWEQGSINAQLSMSKVDDSLAKNATHFELRIMCIPSEGTRIGELWHIFQHVSPAEPHDISECAHSIGDRGNFQHVLGLAGTHYVRFDVFYGGASVLSSPFSTSH